MKLTTHQLTTAGLLSAITAALGITGMGLIPVPTPAVFATIMHIPVIIGGILQGPLVGGLIGLLFGLFTLTAVPDPRIVIPARLVIGLSSYLAFTFAFRYMSNNSLLHSKSRYAIAGALAGVIGTATNSIGTLSLAVIFHYINVPVALAIAISNGIPEAMIAAIVVGGLMVVLGPLYNKKAS